MAPVGGPGAWTARQEKVAAVAATGEGRKRARRRGPVGVEEPVMPAEPLAVRGWGSSGEPEDYDPGAPTGPFQVAQGAGGAGPGEGSEVADEARAAGYDRVEAPRSKLVATVSSAEGTELPHWADPPTGEVPRALVGDHGDDMQAWRLLGSRGLHWRDDANAWSDGPGVEELMGGDQPLGDREDAAPFSFDADFDALEQTRSGRAGLRPGPADGQGGPPGPDRQAAHGEEVGRAPGRRDDTAHGFAPPSGGKAREAGGTAAQQYPGRRATGRDPGPVVIEELEPMQEVRPGTPSANGGGESAEAGDPPGTEGAEPQPTRMVKLQRNAPPPGMRGSDRGSGPSRRGERAQAGNGHGPRGPYDVAEEHGLRARGGRDVGAAVTTGLALGVLVVFCYLVGPGALLALAALAVSGCALEAFSMLQRAGFRPATLVGAMGAAAAVLAAYWRGMQAVPVVTAVVAMASLVWYLARVVEARAVVNSAVSMLGFVWVGVLGSFAGGLLARSHGAGIFLGAVVVTAVADMVAWFVGSRFGAHPLAPAVSPGKTWEGFLAGAVAALVVGGVVGKLVAPWGGASHGLVLGLVVAFAAPLGDLVQSMIKRDLRLKDSGALLPGHGGLLDRFDSMLFVLPATYFLVTILHVG